MKKVYSTTVIGQAEMLQVVLRSHGIESRLENEGGALYAVGVPSAAAPIVIVVDDERAEEAARIIAAEFQKPRTPDPTAIHQQLRCSCGKTLEYPKGEDPPDECPWCGRPTQFSAAPGTTHEAGPKPRKPAAVLLTLLLVGGAILFLALRAREGRSSRGPLEAAEDSQSGWSRKLRGRIEAIPAATVPPVDPESIAAPLLKEFPAEAARFTAAMADASTVDALIERWNRLSVELSPDWGMEHGFADSPRLSRYSARADRTQILMNALALRKLRTVLPSPPPLDGRLFERYLERILLAYGIFGPATSDPRPAFWGVLACLHVQDRPDPLSERLEQVPEVVGEFRRDLANVPRLWLPIALDESNASMVLLREIERTATTDRLKAAVAKAREALSDYESHLRKLRENNRMTAPRDPRWTMFLVRDMEFSGRTPREAAKELFDEANKSYARWRESATRPQEGAGSYTAREWRGELQRLMTRAKEQTLERGFAEIPPGGLPAIQVHPFRTKGHPEWPLYAARSFAPTLQASLWEAPWAAGGDAKQSCSPSLAFVSVAAETFPGRHLQALLSRRDGTLIRRLYWSHGLSEGWRGYVSRWAAETPPNSRSERSTLEGIRFMEAWTGAVQLCYLAGTLTEDEALEMIQGGLGETAERAQAQLAWATLEPLFHVSGILGEQDLLRLRGEMEAKVGAAFDLRQFHTRVLGYGHTPIALLREEMLRAEK